MGIDAHARIAQHGFGTGRRNHDISPFPGIADVPKVRVLFDIFHFRIGQSGLAGRAPIDDARAAIDQPLLIQAHKRLPHRAAEAFVHGKALARPIAGNAQFAKLADDSSAVLFPPRPGALEEALAADLLLGDALGLERVHDFDFRGDGGMVRSRHPKRGIALHAVIADEYILRHFIQRMAHMQLTGDIGRRHDDGKRLFLRIHLGLEGPGIFPHFIDAAFHIPRRKHLVHFKFLHGYAPFDVLIR